MALFFVSVGAWGLALTLGVATAFFLRVAARAVGQVTLTVSDTRIEVASPSFFEAKIIIDRGDIDDVVAYREWDALSGSTLIQGCVFALLRDGSSVRFVGRTQPQHALFLQRELRRILEMH